jgi:hypothetical protein
MVFQFNFGQGGIKRIPRFPGADTSQEGEYFTAAVSSLPMTDFTGNEAYGNRVAFELWSPDMSPGFTMAGAAAWQNNIASFLKYTFAPLTFDRFAVRGYEGTGVGISDNTGPRLHLKRLDFQNLALGASIYPRGWAVVKDSYFRNSTDLEIVHTRIDRPTEVRLEDSTFVDMPGGGSYSIVTTLAPAIGQSETHNLRLPYRIVLDGYSHNSEPPVNLGLYFLEQDPGAILADSAPGFIGSPPEDPGRTNQYYWNTYGFAFGGALAPCATRRSEIGGFACLENPPPPNPADFYTLTPCRLIDTRASSSGGPALLAGETRTFTLAGSCRVPASAAALSVNVTVTQGSGPGNLRLFAGGTPAPRASTINYGAGQTRANNAIVALGADGTVAVRSDQQTGSVHFILDVNGHFQ